MNLVSRYPRTKDTNNSLFTEINMQSTWSRWFLIISIYSMIPHIHGQVKFDKDRFVLEIQANSMPMDRIQSMLPERCGGKNKTDRIVSAEKSAPLTQWPWMARLRGSGSNNGPGWLSKEALVSDVEERTTMITIGSDGSAYRIYIEALVSDVEEYHNDHNALGSDRNALTKTDLNVSEALISHQYECRECYFANTMALDGFEALVSYAKEITTRIAISEFLSIDVHLTPHHGVHLTPRRMGRYKSIFFGILHNLGHLLKSKFPYKENNIAF
ncbi:unnamed protein product, partial [Meganyctiphanes norvegica]